MRIQINTSSRVDKYPAKQHARNVARKLGADGGLIYLIGRETIMLEDSDQSADFRQRRYFYYLTGVDLPDCAMTYSVEHDWLTLFIPEINERDALWSGEMPTREDMARDYDVDAVFYTAIVPRHLDLFRARYPGSTVYTIHDQFAPFPDKGTLKFDSENLQPAMDACRVIKDGHEISLIRRANDVSTSGHTAVFAAASKLKNERELAALFVQQCMGRGADRQAYPPITPAGENCGLLHYIRNNQPLEGKQLVLLDAGAEWKCYAADVTRTFPISGKFTTEARAIYELVLKMQTHCIDNVKRGAVLNELYWQAHMIAIEGLLELGIITKGKEPAELLKLGVSRIFFPHGLGHHLGLDTHDTMYPKPSDDKKAASSGVSVLSHDEFTASALAKESLEPGMVITIEPGIYFNRAYVSIYAAENPEAMSCIDRDVLEKYWAVGGVRIEDDVLVTENGSVNLTTAPKLTSEIEALVRGNAVEW